MKKLLVVLLSLGLIVGLGTSAFAQTTFKMGGGYELRGAYSNNANFGDTDSYSRAAVWQQARFTPVFTIAQGLTFTARIDTLEKQWGNTSWKSATGTSIDETSSRRTAAAIATVKDQENIEVERSYVTFDTKIGRFQIGYMEASVWGTKFADYNITRPRAVYAVPVGPVTFAAVWEKGIEMDNLGYTPTGKTDADTDSYFVNATYKQGPIEAGLLYAYVVGNTTRLAAAPYRVRLQSLQPYVKATFGPVYVEAEFDYYFGKTREYETPSATAINQDKQGWGAYALARWTMGPLYLGGGIGWMSGDQGDDPSKDKSGGWYKDWKPALIMQNNDIPDEFPGHAGSDAPGGAGMGTNSKREQTATYNLFAGFKATPKLEIATALTMAKTTVKFKTGRFVGTNAGNAPAAAGYAAGTEYLSNDIGTELDVTATYKIYDNLTYMIGAGYMWVGDFYKGPNPNKKIDDDYLLIHTLNLSF